MSTKNLFRLKMAVNSTDYAYDFREKPLFGLSSYRSVPWVTTENPLFIINFVNSSHAMNIPDLVNVEIEEWLSRAVNHDR